MLGFDILSLSVDPVLLLEVQYCLDDTLFAVPPSERTRSSVAALKPGFRLPSTKISKRDDTARPTRWTWLRLMLLSIPFGFSSTKSRTHEPVRTRR